MEEENSYKKFVDFHTHSIYSDGDLRPEDNVMIAATSGIDMMALTDHDTIRGVREAIAASRNYPITAIPGVEISTPKYHLLALNFDYQDRRLNEFIDESRRKHNIENEIRILALQRIGVPISYGKVNDAFPNSRIGKANIRKLMMTDPEIRRYMDIKHPGANPHELFTMYLGKGGISGYVEQNTGVSPEEAIREVHNAGGIIGIAHPVKNIDDMAELEILVEQGIDFLEIQPNLDNKKYDQRPFIEFANSHQLPISYGSDYHGPTLNRKPLERKTNVLTEGMKELLEIPTVTL